MEDAEARSREQQQRHQEQFERELAQPERERDAVRINEERVRNGEPSHSLTLAFRRHRSGSRYDNLPLVEPDDLGFAGPTPAVFIAYESACSDSPVDVIEAIISAKKRSPRFLHLGLILAIRAGNVENTRFLLSAGAPIARYTDRSLLSAPVDKQVDLFEVLADNGWTSQTTDHRLVTLPQVVDNLPVLGWLLAHGANPDLGHERLRGTVFPLKRETRYCAALERAATLGNMEAARMLLDAGSKPGSGVPLHCAAGRTSSRYKCGRDAWEHDRRV